LTAGELIYPSGYWVNCATQVMRMRKHHCLPRKSSEQQMLLKNNNLVEVPGFEPSPRDEAKLLADLDLVD
jgi:hypothetical protein